MCTPTHRGDVRPHRFARSTSILHLESGAQRPILAFPRISRMASKDYPIEAGESDVLRERLQELREELAALVRCNSVSAHVEDSSGLADLRCEVERLRCALEQCALSAEMPMTRSSPAVTAEAPSPPYAPYPPYPPYPPYAPVAPFPPYPPYPPNCGCCAPAPCGCPKCGGHAAAPPTPAPEQPPAPIVVPTPSSSSSSSSGDVYGRPVGIRLPSSSSSSRYAQNYIG
jgi:hypothetical protein